MLCFNVTTVEDRNSTKYISFAERDRARQRE
jgi:hypothetical protein